MSRALALALSLGLAVLVAGCGGGGDDDGDESAAEASGEPSETTAGDGGSAAAECALTAEDVTAALGEEMVQVDTAPCTFEPVEFPDTGPFIDYRASVPGVIQQFGAGGSEPVDDLGDEAYFEEGSGNLAVLSGDTAFQIQLNEYDGDARAAVVGLAEGVLAAG